MSPRVAAASLIAFAAAAMPLPALASAISPTSAASSAVAAVPGAPASAAEVIVDRIGPAVLKANGTLTLTGKVINRGTTPLLDGNVSLNLRRRPFTFRAELVAAADERTPLPGAVEVVEAELPETIAPGAMGGWKLSVKTKALKLPGKGVYPMAVTLRSAANAGGVLDTRTTFLPYLPDPKSYTPTKVSWLWPVVADPIREPDGIFPAQQAGSQFAAGGRLHELATAPGDRSVGWFIDPQLLDDASDLAGAHRVRKGEDDEKGSKAEGSAAAEQWVGALRGQLANRPNAAMPYADPDLLGLVRGDAPGLVEQALDRARAITTTVLGRESDTSVIWPPAGLADGATLSTLSALGARTVVLSSSQFPVLETLSYTPTGRARVETDEGALEVLIADDGLTEVLEADLQAPGAFALAQQQLLAETALITLERPNAGRAVLMAPPRQWNPPAGAANGLLAAFAAAPWMTPSGLDTFSTTRVPSELVATEVSDRPAAAAPRLPKRYVRDEREGRDSLVAAARDANTLESVVVDESRAAQEYRAAVLRAASRSWTGNVRGGRAYLGEVRRWVSDDLKKIKIIGRDLVTLSGSRGTIPVTIQNGLSQPIRIRPTIVPLVSGRLRAGSPELLTIAAGRNRSVSIPAEASANGITRVEVRLRDAEGNLYGSPTYLRVNVTNYGSVGLIVVLGGGGLLFAVAIVRNIRRVRRHRHRASGDAPAGEGATRSEDAEEPVQL